MHVPTSAEFMGTLLFQMFGGSAPAKDTSAPAAYGFALVAVIFAFCNISGGHLNPAVSFALMCTGKYPVSIAYANPRAVMQDIFICMGYQLMFELYSHRAHEVVEGSDVHVCPGESRFFCEIEMSRLLGIY